MATLTLKNIPDEVYRRLKERAERHRRSLNSEILVCLEETLRPVPTRVEDTIAEARRLRAQAKGPAFTDEELRALRRAGRP